MVLDRLLRQDGGVVRAIVLGTLGEQPRLGEFAEPSPGPGQETVTVLAAGVNPVDAMIAQGGFPHRRIEPPCVLGLEGVGVTGSGSKVYFSGPVLPFGSFAERTLVRSEATMVVPDALAAEVAVALGVSGIAAELSLFHQGRLVPGETVLVLGASGMVGQITTQLARLGGAGRVIAGTRHALSAEELQSLRADAQVSLTYPETLDVGLRETAPGGIDLVIDLVWGAAIPPVIRSCANGARIVQTGSAAALESTIPAREFRNRGLKLIGHTNFLVPFPVRRDAYAKLTHLAQEGKLSIGVDARPLDDFPQVWARLSEPGKRRKLVLLPPRECSPA